MKTKIQNTLLTLTLLAGWHRAAAQAVDDANRAPAQTVYIGNSLTVTNGGPDGVPPLVILGEYSPSGPLATSPIIFPDAGKVTQVKFYGGNYDFTLYALSFVGGGSNANEQTFKVDAAASFSGSSTNSGVQTLSVSNFSVNAGDFLAFSGIGPYYPQNPNNALHSDATYENASQATQNLFVADGGSGNIYEFTPGGAKSTFASGLNGPFGLAFNSTGDLFVAANGSGNIYEYTPGGAKSTFASGLYEPRALAFSSVGILFETGGFDTIYEFTPGGVQSTFFNSIYLQNPGSLAFNSAGLLYVGSFSSIYEFTPGGVESILVTGVNGPYGLAFNSAGDLFEADEASGNIYEFTTLGARSTFASGLDDPIGLAFQPVPVGYDNDTATPPLPGAEFTVGINRDPNATYGYIADNFGHQGRTYAIGVEFQPNERHDCRFGQNLFVSDWTSGNIYEFTPDGVKSIFASGLYYPMGLAFNSAGDLFVGTSIYGTNIYKFTPDGVKSVYRSIADSYPLGLAFNQAGDLFASSGDNNVYEFTPAGVQSVIAFLPEPGLGLAFNSTGDLFVDTMSQARFDIIEITPGGVQSTFASWYGYYPGALAFNGAGTLFEADGGYAADGHSGIINQFTPAGGQSTFASGLDDPLGLAFNSAGDLFVADYGSGNIYEFTPDGTQFLFATGLPSPESLAFTPRSEPAQTVYIGNPALEPINGGPDGVPPLVIMGEYSPAGPLAASTAALPSGTVQDVKFYGQNYDFTLYALSYVGPGGHTNEQSFRVVSSQHFSGTNAAPGTITLEVSNFRVKDGDFLAFAGIGPFYPQQPNDALNTGATYEDSAQPVTYDNDTATPPGGPGAEFTVGINRDSDATYGYIADNFGNQGRTYAIGVEVQPTPGHFQHHEDHGHHGDHSDHGDHGDHSDHGGRDDHGRGH